MGPEAIEHFAEYAARVVLGADEFAKTRIPEDLDPGLAERDIRWLKFTLDKDCSVATNGAISSVNLYELGPSTRSVRGLVCTFPPDIDGTAKSALYEWDYLDPTSEPRQTTVIILTDPQTGEIQSSSSNTGFSEEDLRTIEAAIRGYEEGSDAQA